MYALLATTQRFTHETLAARIMLHVEIIQMGCFNGLNMTEAFVSQRAGGFRDLSIEIDETGNPVADESITANSFYARTYGAGASESTRMARAFDGYTAGAKQTIGVGYINYNSGGAQRTTAQMTPPPSNTNTNQKADPYVGELLYREGFMSPYRSPVTGVTRPSLRVLTPNEQILSNCFSAFERQTRAFPDGFANTLSRVAITVTHNKAWRGALYQFVGSERPSGQAIAYLQAWRNCCEYSNNYGFAEVAGQRQTCQIIATNRAWDNVSVIAVLSHLFNSGDDSDIITFAGNHYLSYCTKVGYWNTTNLFRDQSSMLQEGRYNKGGQSSAIRDRLHRLRSMASRSEHHALWTVDLGKQLDTMRATYGAANRVAYDTRMDYLAGFSTAGQTDKNNILNRIRDNITAMWNANPQGNLQTFLTEAQRLPDLTIPVAATTPAQPATDFVQWQSQAAETLH